MQGYSWGNNMIKDSEHEELSETVDSGKMHNITSKAGRLAMELAAEKKRLAQELEELQGEYDDIKPLTPTGTRDWYCLLYTSPSPRDRTRSRMPSSA